MPSQPNQTERCEHSSISTLISNRIRLVLCPGIGDISTTYGFSALSLDDPLWPLLHHLCLGSLHAFRTGKCMFSHDSYSWLLTGSFEETYGFSSHFHPWLNPISWLIFLIAFWMGCISRLVAKHQRTHCIRITRWIWDYYCWNLMDFTYVSFIYFYMYMYIV